MNGPLGRHLCGVVKVAIGDRLEAEGGRDTIISSESSTIQSSIPPGTVEVAKALITYTWRIMETFGDKPNVASQTTETKGYLLHAVRLGHVIYI